MYSALKYNGKPLYEYAREGISIERKSRDVVIHKLELLEYDPLLEQITFCALVSKGTYIRTLAEDIGNELDCGASLIALRRTATTHFQINQAISLDTLQNTSLNQLSLLNPDQLAQQLPAYNLTSAEFNIFKFGNITPSVTEHSLNEQVRCYANEVFLGVGEFISYQNQFSLKPKRLISNLKELLPWGNH